MTDTSQPLPRGERIRVTGPDLLTPAEVAALFRVEPATVTKWDHRGRFPQGAVIRTVGGQRRFRREFVEALLNGDHAAGGVS